MKKIFKLTILFALIIAYNFALECPKGFVSKEIIEDESNIDRYFIRHFSDCGGDTLVDCSGEIFTHYFLDKISKKYVLNDDQRAKLEQFYYEQLSKENYSLAWERLQFLQFRMLLLDLDTMIEYWLEEYGDEQMISCFQLNLAQQEKNYNVKQTKEKIDVSIQAVYDEILGVEKEKINTIKWIFSSLYPYKDLDNGYMSAFYKFALVATQLPIMYRDCRTLVDTFKEYKFSKNIEQFLDDEFSFLQELIYEYEPTDEEMKYESVVDLSHFLIHYNLLKKLL